MDNYRPLPYNGKITLFQTPQDPAFEVEKSDWGNLVTGELEIIQVPGDHYSVIGQANAGALANYIIRRLS